MKHALPIILAIVATSVSAADRPRFHGPNSDNNSPDTGLLKAWPEGGPSQIWAAAGIGEGYSSVVIAADTIYTSGAIGEDCVIIALNAGGEIVWQRQNGNAWKGSYPGTRGTPTIDGGLLYHLSGMGSLICVKADSGELVWSVNILEKFDGRNIRWGLSESLLVTGDKVICSPGSEDIGTVALDKMMGNVI
jgi:outer membrane protein assembly factor BamB